MLTSKQKDLLIYIHDCVQATGVPPSFDEMKAALDLRSKSGIHRLITALEERGFVRRLPHRARALEIIKLPDALQDPQKRRTGFEPTVVEGGKSAAGTSAPPHQQSAHRPVALHQPVSALGDTVTVPLMGRIAAGVPISAIQNHSQDVICPPDMLGKGEHYALEVKGDSMIEAGIHEGDIVIIRRTASADNGDIVVALVENEEATLKRIRKTGATIALEAANPSYETRYFGPDQIQVQGRLVGLMRRY